LRIKHKREIQEKKEKKERICCSWLSAPTNKKKEKSRGKPATELHKKIIDIERKIQNLQNKWNEIVTNV